MIRSSDRLIWHLNTSRNLQPVTNFEAVHLLIPVPTLKMSKNPFVNCKSRKRRKTRPPVIKSEENLFCPRTMVRYDASHSEFPTKWVCKMCLKVLLSEEAVKNHLIICSNQYKRAIPPQQMKKNEDTPYICEHCSMVFQRRVTLNKHIESHEKPPCSLESEEDDEVGAPLVTEHANEDKDKPEEQSIQ